MNKYDLVIKAICKDFTRGVAETIDAHVSYKNVNKIHQIYSLNSPLVDPSPYSGYGNRSVKVTLLTIACYHRNFAAAEYLLQIGADPNSWIKGSFIKESSPMATAIHANKNQMSRLRNVKLLLDYGGSLEQVLAFDSHWRSLIQSNNFDILDKLFIDYRPSNLIDISYITDKFPFFAKKVSTTYPDLFKKYPLISDLVNFEKRSVVMRVHNPVWMKKDDSFFRNTSLKEALQKRYRFSSAQFCKIANERLFARKKDYVNVNATEFLKEADVLKKLFLDRAVPNYSDFLEIISSDNDTMLALTFASKKEVNFLKTFSDNQLKDLIYNSNNMGIPIELLDIATMYTNNREKLTAARNNVSFSEINNFEKLHHWINKEVSHIEQKDFKLNQVKKFPHLLNLSKVKLPEGYGIKLAETQHELIKWGNIMDHCVGSSGYGHLAKDGELILLAITKDSVPTYCVEITKSGRINQIQGNSRSQPSKEVTAALTRELRKIKVLKDASVRDI